jgi:hypothetical protein
LARVGGEKKKVAEPPDTDIGIPTTQVKMGTTADDPLRPSRHRVDHGSAEDAVVADRRNRNGCR